jgi:ABC-2 type transport system ATP-binding protein
LSESIITVRNLNKTYTTYERGSSFKDSVKSLFVRKPLKVEAVKNISFEIQKGEICGFLGPNGAGKSTTLKILTGILFPTHGEVNILGYVPWKQRREYVARIGAVFGQKSQLLWDIPPADAFELNRAIYNIPRDRFKKNLAAMVELLDVGEVMGKPTRVLSLGERMKCEFIIAMLHDPEIVFLDEPTIGLDVVAKEKIRGFVKEMNQKGTTFILTTHDLDDVESLARQIILINHGEIIFNDPIEKLSRFFGCKKKINLQTDRSQIDFQLPGLKSLDRRNDTHGNYELDLDILPLKAFLAQADEILCIKDMSIEEIPIESVITALYETKKPED